MYTIALAAAIFGVYQLVGQSSHLARENADWLLPAGTGESPTRASVKLGQPLLLLTCKSPQLSIVQTFNLH